jgi:hypothetical protein
MTTTIQTPTSNLGNSLDFYSRLGFSKLISNGRHLFTDGKAIIEIAPERYARAGVLMFRDSWQETVSELEKITELLKIEGGYLFSDPSGCWVYLMQTEEIQDFDLSGFAPSVLENYAGLSLEVVAIEISVHIWGILGFSITMGKPEQGWVVMKNEEGFGISLMKPMSCPHLFFNPSLTYFNGAKNPEIIQEINDLDIPITEEITHFNKQGIVDNIIIRDPGGLGFFLFSD